jgi:hypothetical protein
VSLENILPATTEDKYNRFTSHRAGEQFEDEDYDIEEDFEGTEPLSIEDAMAYASNQPPRKPADPFFGMGNDDEPDFEREDDPLSLEDLMNYNQNSPTKQKPTHDHLNHYNRRRDLENMLVHPAMERPGTPARVDLYSSANMTKI